MGPPTLRTKRFLGSLMRRWMRCPPGPWVPRVAAWRVLRACLLGWSLLARAFYPRVLAFYPRALRAQRGLPRLWRSCPKAAGVPFPLLLLGTPFVQLLLPASSSGWQRQHPRRQNAVHQGRPLQQQTGSIIPAAPPRLLRLLRCCTITLLLGCAAARLPAPECARCAERAVRMCTRCRAQSTRSSRRGSVAASSGRPPPALTASLTAACCRTSAGVLFFFPKVNEIFDLLPGRDGRRGNGTKE